MLNNLKNFFKTDYLLVVYMYVNSFFILKYGERIYDGFEYGFLFFYVAFILLLRLLVKKNAIVINDSKYFFVFFLIASIIMFLLQCLLVFGINGNTVQVDRWSALQVFIENILNGDYPYDKQDHLGKTTSNLPSLFYIGLPFYLINNIGLLQPFVFVILMLFVNKASVSNVKKTMIVLLLLFSPAYWWEVAVKSDLMSNLLIVTLFIWYWKSKYSKNIFHNSIMLSFWVSFIVLTRGVVAIPLVLLLFHDFMKLDVLYRVKFLFIVVVFTILLMIPVLITVPSLDYLLIHNPFNHQTKYAPIFLIFFSLVAPFLLSKHSTSIYLIQRNSMWILFLLIFITFIINIYEEGWCNNIYGIVFDISYISMILPFIVISYLFQSDYSKT
ncbi:hypothetical protein [Tenacibaculum geojense]|uniref:Glycosyltransferase RgtA/B/C/D-like domain-containing protein n=1 Tax=Tenacibaculum geojense TaxID=915352 RepID=A0ABW3JT91_9FLAO